MCFFFFRSDLSINVVIVLFKKGTMRLGRRTTHFVKDDSIIRMY